MSLDIGGPDCPTEPTLCFTSSDLKDVFSHEDDPDGDICHQYGRKVHKVFDGFVSPFLRFLLMNAEAPWIDGGTRLS